jgi:hypothetical protein
MKPDHSIRLAADLLRGADALAHFIYGASTGTTRARVYRNHGNWPLWRDGAVICGRKSALMAEIAKREAAAIRKGKTAA